MKEKLGISGVAAAIGLAVGVAVSAEPSKGKITVQQVCVSLIADGGVRGSVSGYVKEEKKSPRYIHKQGQWAANDCDRAVATRGLEILSRD